MAGAVAGVNTQRAVYCRLLKGVAVLHMVVQR